VANAVEPLQQPTLETAMDILETKMAALGVVLRLPEVKSSEKVKVAGKLLSLPPLIHLAITFALDTRDGSANPNCAGKVSMDWSKTLMLGNTPISKGKVQIDIILNSVISTYMLLPIGSHRVGTGGV
jgi:hypothetical protein